MISEKRQLIDELIADSSRAESTLQAASKILRRRRQWRSARRAIAIVAFLAALACLIQPRDQKQISARILPPQTAVAAPFQAKSLTDSELLSLFPNTPVGLATLPNGKKLFLFAHPADQAKYATRL